MLQYEFKRLEELAEPFRSAVKPECYSFEQIAAAICKEYSRIRLAFRKALFTATNSEAFERYIRLHQAAAVHIIGQLQHYPGADHPKEAAAILLNCFVQLLEHLESDYLSYIDRDLPLPTVFRKEAFTALQPRASGLLELIGARVQSPLLKHAVEDYLEHVGQQQLPASTFGSLAYLRTFINTLEEVFAEHNVGGVDELLTITLLHLNFNHLGFLVYYQDQIRQQLKLTETPEDIQELLNSHSIYNHQLPEKPRYHLSWPHAGAMANDWLKEISANSPKIITSPASGIGTALSEKLPWSLSVAQIACLTRLFYEEGCFAPNSSVTDVLKFTTMHYRSKKQESISKGSISKEYYSTDQVTAATIRDLCQRMVSRINRHYFPV